MHAAIYLFYQSDYDMYFSAANTHRRESSVLIGHNTSACGIYIDTRASITTRDIAHTLAHASIQTYTQ
jgi:hypothetical protein